MVLGNIKGLEYVLVLQIKIDSNRDSMRLIV